jgi:hypothetical protein
LQEESARTLIHDDVIALDRKPGVHGEIPEQEMGPYFLPRLAKWGKPRWFSERIKRGVATNHAARSKALIPTPTGCWR